MQLTDIILFDLLNKNYFFFLFSPQFSNIFTVFFDCFVPFLSQFHNSVFSCFISPTKTLLKVPFAIFMGSEIFLHSSETRINGNMKLQYPMNTASEGKLFWQALTNFARLSQKHKVSHFHIMPFLLTNSKYFCKLLPSVCLIGSGTC